MNDALQSIRLALGKKAFLFQTQIRPGGAKTGKTRPWDNIHSADAELRHAAQLYQASRAAISNLARPDLLGRYPKLEQKDLKTSTTLLDTSVHGQKHDKLPWFWYFDVAGDSEANDQMHECELVYLSCHSSIVTSSVHRINWLRAKANFDRAREEVNLVEHEMEWTVRYFRWKASSWEPRKISGRSLGHDWYAARQYTMWMRFAVSAEESFTQAGVALSL
jgi:hypothetical protein